MGVGEWVEGGGGVWGGGGEGLRAPFHCFDRLNALDRPCAGSCGPVCCHVLQAVVQLLTAPYMCAHGLPVVTTGLFGFIYSI